MPIEFRCTKCSKLLRTPDETAGKQARCPECGTILPIPSSTPAGAPLAPIEDRVGHEPLSESGNPYQSPAATEKAPLAEQGRKQLTFEAAYVHTWRIFKQRCPILYAVIAILTLFALGQVFAKHYLADFGTPMIAAVMIVGTLFQWWLLVGLVHVFLKVAQGKPASFSDLFSGSPWFLRFIGATILFALAAFVGFLLCFVPGIFVGLMFSQYSYLIIDRDEGVLDSLGKSRELTKGNRLTLLAVFIVSMLPLFLISMPLPFLVASPLEIEVLSTIAGAIFNPWIYLLGAVCYLLITGQTTADQAPTEPDGLTTLVIDK